MIHIFGEGQPSGNGRSGKYKYVCVCLAELFGNGHGSSDVTQPIGIMGIHQDIKGGKFIHQTLIFNSIE